MKSLLRVLLFSAGTAGLLSGCVIAESMHGASGYSAGGHQRVGERHDNSRYSHSQNRGPRDAHRQCKRPNSGGNHLCSDSLGQNGQRV